MRKAVKGVLVMLGLVLGWLAIVASGWLPRITPEQRAAQAALAAEPANVKGEHNAFAALALFEYDIPEAELDAVAKADVAAFEAWSRKRAPKEPFVSTAAAKFNKFPSISTTDPDLCQAWAPECIARVRKDPAATRAKVAQAAKQLEQLDRLDRFDHYHYGFEARMDSPIGVTTGGAYSLMLTASALDFVDGKVAPAFDRVCRNVKTWRHLRSHADLLVIDMIGIAYMTGASRLYAEMLAEQPKDFVAPCPEAFASLSDAEIDQCATYRFEYGMFVNTMNGPLFGKGGALADGQNAFTARVLGVLFNEEHGKAIVAEAIGPYCMQPHRDRVHKRSPAPLVASSREVCGTIDKVFDPFGCVMMAVVAPSYDDYYKRMLDLDARVKLVGSVIWLRAQPADGDRAAQFAARPAELQSPEHAMSIDVERGVVRMVPINKSKGESWEIPFKATAAAPAAAG